MHKRGEHLADCFELPQATWRSEEWGEMHVSFETYREEYDSRPLLRGLPGDRCECPHWGVVLDGSMRVIYGEEEEVIGAGALYYLRAGHNIVVAPGTWLIELSPREAFAAHVSAVEAKKMHASG